MNRLQPTSVLVLIAFLCVIGWPGPVAAQPGQFEELGVRTQRDLAEKARAYLDPDVEFLWRPRRDFIAALTALEASDGIHALKDVSFLRQVVYQGRHFLTPFDDRTWQSAHGVEFKRKGIFRNLKSEEWRFTYTLPRDYPDARRLAAIPRKDTALPLLVSLHEIQDTRGADSKAEEFPGMAVLERRYPKSTFRALYDNWLTLAPVAARARFLEDDKSVRHLFLTAVLTEFWRHYHVDFDRIVLDGSDAAAAMAAVFPNVFAGLVLRGGPIEEELVQNYAAVPVYVVGDPWLAKRLVELGHPDVASGGDDETLLRWLDERRRVVPASFTWRMTRDEHRYANWIILPGGGPTRSMKVDTDRGDNRITITAEGAGRLQMFLNDDVVDLDRPVEVVLNGETYTCREKRSFGQLFDKDPYVRRNMTFGWLYPVLIKDVKVPEKKAGEEEPSPTDEPTEPVDTGPKGTPEEEAQAKKWFDRGEAAYAEDDKVKAQTWYRKAREVGRTSYWRRAEDRLATLEGRAADPIPAPPPLSSPPKDMSAEARLAVQHAFLYGRLDVVGVLLENARKPQDRLPLAVRDLWWRPTHDPEHESEAARLFEASKGLVRDQYLWLLDGGVGPYPEAQDPHLDPWPVITALVRDRQYRETIGRADLPEASPLASLTPPTSWAEWWPEWRTWFLEGILRPGFEGEDPASLSDEIQKEMADGDALASKVGMLNLWLSILAGLLFVGGVLVAGRLLGPRPKAE